MKKNKMMRIASVLLVAVLMSTCAISGTFAKYVTSAEGGDSARVAKWGVGITATTGAFGAAYKSADGKISTTYNAAADSVYSANGTDKVVAPGTGDTLATLKIEGAPEVDTIVEVAVNFNIGENWTAEGANYFPLVVKVGDTTVSYNLDATAADIEAAVEKAIIDAVLKTSETITVTSGTSTASKNYEANSTELAHASDIAVTWSWPIETGADDAAKAVNNKKDTVLGNKTGSEVPEISVSVSITVTQAD